jgi:hypothetical protein
LFSSPTNYRFWSVGLCWFGTSFFRSVRERREEERMERREVDKRGVPENSKVRIYFIITGSIIYNRLLNSSCTNMQQMIFLKWDAQFGFTSNSSSFLYLNTAFNIIDAALSNGYLYLLLCYPLLPFF